MNAVGLVLGEIDDREPATSAMVFLHCVNGAGVELLPYSRAEALLRQVTASAALHISGDLASGFAWPHPGAHPRYSQSVVPLSAPIWPNSPYATPVMIELWWPLDQAGYRQVRSFVGWFNDPYAAYLTACCLWSTAATGAGAEAAYLYGSDRSTVYRINDMALTCSQIPAQNIARIAATASEHDTNFPLPDEPARRSAVNDGSCTSTGTRAEVADSPVELADSRQASQDPVAIQAPRQAAEQAGSDELDEPTATALFRVADRTAAAQAEAVP